MKNITILNSRVDNLTKPEALKLIKQFVISKKPHQICTVNPEYLMEAQRDKELQCIINNSAMNTPDGGGLLFASRYLGTPIAEKITGVDLVRWIFSLANKSGWKIFLLGGQHGVAQKTVDNMKKLYPKIRFVGVFEGNPILKPISKQIYESGYKTRRSIDLKLSKMLPKSNIDIIQKIISAKPDILLVAYGCPKQDKFIARYSRYIRVPVMIGVGGTFDYLSGEAKYAPQWMRNLHLEWLYRLFQNPAKRWNRIITAVFRFPWTVLTSNNKLVK